MRSVFFRYFSHGISRQSAPRRDPIVGELLQVDPFDGPCQRRLAPPSAPCAPRSSVLAPFTDPVRPCRRPDRLSRRLEREESPEAMLTRRLRRGRRARRIRKDTCAQTQKGALVHVVPRRTSQSNAARSQIKKKNRFRSAREMNE